MTACRLCGSPAARLWSRDDLDLHRCRQCRFVFATPTRVLSPAERYQHYYAGADAAAPVERYRQWLERAEATVGRGSLLEIGAGAGGFARAAVERGWRVAATEVSRSAVERLRASGAAVFEGDLEAAGYSPGSFDVVVSLEVIEHVEAPLAYLKEARRVTRAGGLLLLTTPNFGGLSRRVLGKRWRVLSSEHLGYFTPRTLRRALRDAGYEPASVRSRSLDVTTWRSSARGEPRFDPAASARVRDTIQSRPVLRVAREAAHTLLGFTGMGDSILAWARVPAA